MDPLTIFKNFIEVLYISKNIIITYATHPAICIQTDGIKFNIRVHYLDGNVFYFNNPNDLYIFVCKYTESKNKKITRIEMNNSSSTDVLYGPLYEYEKKYSKDNTIHWDKHSWIQNEYFVV